MSGLLLAALTWDPEIRGALIIVTAVAILCGSVYLLLMTNTGSRLGFLITVTGLTGWLALMGWVWVGYGIGMKGQPATWEVKEVVTGASAPELSTVEAVDTGFPGSWTALPLGNPVLGEAQASADHVLVTPTGEAAGAKGGAAERFGPVFDNLDDYTLVNAYQRGGEDYYLPGGGLERSNGFMKGWFHKPNYAVVEVKPVIAQDAIDGVPARPTADPKADSTYVIMERNLGNVRFPSFLFALANSVLFGVFAVMLHERDKAIMSARAQPATA
ncbi:MAG: hypothetical protein ACR2H3_10480 [Acidimicrobiales bacterium]